jgi:flagellar hook-length control protein FliK
MDTSAYKSPDNTATASGLSVELRSMVQQQLHTLETHQLTWSGEIWPNQHMQWEIQGQPEQHAQRADERQWSTEMELALNKLGDVHARLVYTQSAIKLTLHAADAQSVELFNRRLPALHNTLSEAGINLSSAVIEKT